MDKCDQYIDQINKNVLPYIDYDRLQQSYDTDDKSYAKITLYTLHGIAEQIYGPALSCHGEVDFAILPGVIRAKDTGKVCLALLGLDLDSSGEHCSTDFLTQYGVVSQGHIESPAIQAFIKETYGPYDYGYSLPVHGDIHVCPEQLPGEITDILTTFESHMAEFTDQILDGQAAEADEDLEEEMR